MIVGDEPYITEHKLVDEFADGVRMFGYKKNNILVGVMGIQKLKKCYLDKTCLHFNILSRNRYRKIIVTIFIRNKSK